MLIFISVFSLKKYAKILVAFLSFPSMALAQSQGWNYSIEGQSIFTQGNRIPFWFRANQNESIPISGISGSLIGNVYKDYDSTKHAGINWGAGIEARGNFGGSSNLRLIEGYLKARAGIFEVKAGRYREISGIVDTVLSSGAFSISGNALGIPQVSVAIPQYQYLPFTNKLLAIKASYAAGIIGKRVASAGPNFIRQNINTYYQQNAIYLRLGKPNWKLSLFGGINHHVMFGDERQIFGDSFNLNPLKTFIYAAIGKTFVPDDKSKQNLTAKVGNHIGSIDMSLQYEFDNVRLLVYRQSLYDIGAIGHFANIKDGINGISLTNKRFDAAKTDWHRILFEIIYTKDQAGYHQSKRTNSGDENYYNNDEYVEGWTYNALNMGNPLLTTAAYVRSNLPIDLSDPDYIINNRILAFHSGFEGSKNHINIIAKLTYSRNYGTYGTSIEGHSMGDKFYPRNYGLFGEVNQFSGYLEANKSLKNNLIVGTAIAGDVGGLYYNSLGLIFRLKKVFK